MSRTLLSLSAGERATVIGFKSEDAGVLRLMHMGIVEGAEIELVRYAPGGDPLEIRVMGYNLSLRRQEAGTILLDDDGSP
jgi:ferrous iron transport protein A